jgi:hypothetical protein
VQDLAAGPAGGIGQLVEQDAGQRGQPEHHLGQPTQGIRRAGGVADGTVHGLPKDCGIRLDFGDAPRGEHLQRRWQHRVQQLVRALDAQSCTTDRA